MRAIADDKLEVSEAFAEEMYFCLGCLACQTACPAGVDYATLIETARAEVERQGILDSPKRNLIRSILLRRLFTSCSGTSTAFLSKVRARKARAGARLVASGTPATA
jgi:Fe-S oxidoreductase